MMSSMSEIVKNLKTLVKKLEIVEIDEREVKIEVPCEKTLNVLSFLKGNGYSHLSILTAVDWIEKNKFEIVYVLFSWENGGKFVVSTKIDRKKAKFVSVMHLWPIARFYERELHEFFGIQFEGNDDMRPLFLENWDSLPPLRKDFDPLEYSKEKFPDREYIKDVIYEAKVIRGDLNG